MLVYACMYMRVCVYVWVYDQGHRIWVKSIANLQSLYKKLTHFPQEKSTIYIFNISQFCI